MSGPGPSDTEWIPITPGASITESLLNQLNAIGTAAADSATAAAASATAAAASAAASAADIAAAAASASAAAASAASAAADVASIGSSVTAAAASATAAAGSASAASTSATNAADSATAASGSASTASSEASAALGYASSASSSASAASTSASSASTSAGTASTQATAAAASASAAATSASGASTSATNAASSASAASGSATAAAASASAAAASAASIQGIPSGGTTGQALAKTSNTDYAVSWQSIAADLSNLNATNLTSGTVPDARFPATLPAMSGVNLTALNATNLGSGTVPDARFPATLPAASGINLTALNATNLGSGTVPTARLGSGTANSTTVLYGDQTYKAAPAGAGWTTLSKSADQSTSSGSYVDDSTLQTPALATTTTYRIRGRVQVTFASGGSGINYQWECTGPSVSRFLGHATVQDNNGGALTETEYTDYPTDVTIPTDAGTPGWIQFDFILTTSSSAVFKFRASSYTSPALTICAGSYLEYAIA